MPEIIHKPHSGGQEAFLSSNVDELFIGGEKGNGKSWLLLQEFLYDVEEPDASAILLRRTYPDLEDLWSKARSHYQGYAPKFNDSSHMITFQKGSRLKFSHLQHVKNVYNHTGQEYSLIMFDELPNFPLFVFQFLISCLRSTNPNLKARVRGTGNPVGEGIGWVKRRYIDSLKPYEIGYFKTVNDRDVRTDKGDPLAMSRMWIPGIRSENVTLMINDPGYEAKLESLPEYLKRAFKHGIWDSTDLPYQVVKSSHWKKALEMKDFPPGRYGYIGADYAASKDKCAICSGRGDRVTKFQEFDGMDTWKFADEIEKEIHAFGVEQCVIAVDANGPGAGVFHELQRRGYVNLFPCTFKDGTFDPKINKPQIVKVKFDNFRSQAWWKLGENMEDGEIDLSALLTEKSYYDNIYQLEEEVLIHTYKLHNDKVIIVSKDELRKVQMSDGRPGLGRSPDRADALIYWNWIRGRIPEIKKVDAGSEDYGFFSKKTRGLEQKRKAKVYT
jgi:hypothetical protein